MVAKINWSEFNKAFGPLCRVDLYYLKHIYNLSDGKWYLNIHTLEFVCLPAVSAMPQPSQYNSLTNDDYLVRCGT